ncbi:nucleoside 2-deoxyribosyltransferase [Candidatus Pacearchaeota archaeon]|nr:nucleoside 2-deoxyribosyltransferase [Candidatus Pacearchaeota archaeon]
MRVYIAGKLGTENEIETLEMINKLCKDLGIETFLPHRDVGIAKGINDVEMIFKGDIIEGFKNCNMVIASLDGIHIGSGTAWELGYAYAKGIPIIGLKTDESIEDALDYLSPIIVASTKIVKSYDELKEELRELISLCKRNISDN